MGLLETCFGIDAGDEVELDEIELDEIEPDEYEEIMCKACNEEPPEENGTLCESCRVTKAKFTQICSLCIEPFITRDVLLHRCSNCIATTKTCIECRAEFDAPNPDTKYCEVCREGRCINCEGIIASEDEDARFCENMCK